MSRRASAKRHAQAVFQIALDRGELDRWLDDLDTLAATFEDPQFKSVLESPKVRLDKKLDLVRSQLAGVNPLALNLASLLVAKGRVGITGDMASEYRRLIDSHRGLETVEVTTAVPLDEQSKNQIADQLKKAIGKEIVLSTSVAPQIIGGLVIKMGDDLIDGSTRAKLTEMRRALVEQRT